MRNGCGDTPEEKGQEALDKLLRYATKKAEAIQDYINREEMLFLSLQTEMKLARP